MFDQELIEAIAAIADDHEIDRTALVAVTEVESGGRTTAIVKGREEPLIRFEGHCFYRLLPRLKRNRAIVAGLAHPIAGHVGNPLRQAGRWKLLERACAIDRPAALSATSWGVGQIMGMHWRWLGYASIDAFVGEMRGGAAGQVRAMARFIVKTGLRQVLDEQDWAGFARAYNGPDYRRGRYDEKLEQAYRRHGGKAVTAGRHSLALLRLGAHGAVVEQLQRNLRVLGYPLIADGDFGPATLAALERFQASARLKADGVCGPKTFEVMSRRLPRDRVAA